MRPIKTDNSGTPSGVILFLKSRPAAVLLAGALCMSVEAKPLRDSKHNLSATGPGIRAVRETHMCIFCHTPHNANPAAPHWNRPSHGAIYTPYQSSTAKATFGQPTGSSKLCLSCHDGTVALGMIISKAPVQLAGGIRRMPRGRANLGTDLSDDHPISFVYDSQLAALNGELNDPEQLDRAVRLDADGVMQCTTCHDPHNDQFGQFLVKNNAGSALCVECHNKNYWSGSEHQLSTASWNGSGIDPWPNSTETTVEANGCGSCHTPHDAESGERLLRYEEEEQVCYACHNGNVAATNIEAEFNKISVHPVDSTTGVHDPTEDPVNSTRHVECADCHNPHATLATAAAAPEASGAMNKVKGVGSSGSVIDPIANEYELCYRCHADSIDRGAAHIIRQFPQTNTRLEFSASNVSYHPVETIGKNPNVPGLIHPYNESSLIYCTDCHNSDQSPVAGGNGPNGPHGSSFVPLLARNLRFVDGVPESPAEHALCYQCHDRATLLSDASGFPEHASHVGGQSNAACTTCHDPHGSTLPHLINFNLEYVQSLNGILEYISTGPQAGECTLTCHGVDHSGLRYE
jgi:predicted CXXCH cytochrome family protein